MASPRIFSGGYNLAGTVFRNGPPLLQLAPSYLSGTVQWLDTISGSNANSGLLPELPVATLAQAVTNSAANGLIIIGEGSAQSLVASQVINLAGLYVIGCGVGSLRPRFTCTGAVEMLSATAAGIHFRNLYFPASTAAATSRISFTAASGGVRECYFECGASDTNRAVRIHTGASNTEVLDNSFVTTASRPAVGLEFTAATSDCRVERCIFDGGSFGWTDAAFKVTTAATRLNVEDVSLLRRSDYSSVTASTYQLFGLSSDGTGSIDIAA